MTFLNNNVILNAVICFTLIVFVFVFVLDMNSILKKKNIIKLRRQFKGSALVIVPCKGKDITLYDNLRSLKSQSYNNYNIVAIIDSEEDPAVYDIKKVGLKYIITDKKFGGSGKVKAIATAVKKFYDYEAYVIVDSDVYVEHNWLESLLAPLNDKNIGLSTMYPFFNPLRKNFWSSMKMIWGFVGDSLLENESRRFGWGGSLAFRKDILDKEGLLFFTTSKYSVSDDISLTKIAKKKKLRIAYVEKPKPIVNCNETFPSFFEWANRQTALTLLGYRKTLLLGIIYYTSEIIIFISGIVFSIFISPIFIMFFLHTMKSIMIAFKRAKTINLFIFFAVLFAPFLYEVNLVIASNMKKINWRGKSYELRQTSRKN